MRIALGYANRAALAQNNLGFRITAALLAARPEIRLERFYLPDAGLPLLPGTLRTEPSRLQLASVDLVLFSLSFEGDAPHVPAILSAGGLPPLAEEREQGHPLVVAGGAVIMINPEPLAAFCDLFLVGEAEVLLAAFLERWQVSRGIPRLEALAALQMLPGAVVPLLRQHYIWSLGKGDLQTTEQVSLSRQDGSGRRPVAWEALATVATVKWQEAAQQVSSARLPSQAHFTDSLLLELGRGCPRRCRFCVARRIYAPLRNRSAELLLEEAFRRTEPGEAIGLLSLSAGDHPELETLVRDLDASGRRLSIASLPATFARREVVRALLHSGARTLTIAPETGSDRLRALVGKPLENDAILRGVELLGAEGLGHLRTYFMIGLPFEEEQDLRELLGLLGEMRARLPRAARLSATVNVFVPKPRTPFQWAPMAAPAYLREASSLLRKELPRGIRLRVKSLREARWHAALARGDAAWGGRLVRMALKGESPRGVLRREGIRLEDLTRPVDPDAQLPWGYLSNGQERSELLAEWKRAAAEAAKE